MLAASALDMAAVGLLGSDGGWLGPLVAITMIVSVSGAMTVHLSAPLDQPLQASHLIRDVQMLFTQDGGGGCPDQDKG